MNAKLKAALESYARSFVVAAIAVYSAGETDLKAILIAGLAAVAGPCRRCATRSGWFQSLGIMQVTLLRLPA